MTEGPLQRLRIGRVLVGGGASLLLLASMIPWFRVPFRWDPALQCWSLLTPEAEGSFRVLAAALGGLLLATSVLDLCRWRAPAFLGIAGLVVVGLFPCAVTVHDAEVGGAAAWFERTHRCLVWLGGDIALSQGATETLTEEDILVSDLPVSFRSVPSPQRWNHDEALSLLAPSAEWMGYSNAFAAFVRAGWVASQFGLLLVVAGCILSARRSRTRLGEAAAAFAVAVTTAVVLALLPVQRAAHALDEAEEATRRGRPIEALSLLEDAARALPLFGEDSHFIAQHGLLTRRAGQNDSPSAKLYLARVLEGETEPALARATYRSLVLESSARDAVRREAARSLARVGVNALNSGLLEEGQRALEEARFHLSADPKLEYSLQLVWLRKGELDRLAESSRKMIALYEEVNLPSSDAVVAVGLERLSRAHLAADDPDAAARFAELQGRPR